MKAKHERNKNKIISTFQMKATTTNGVKLVLLQINRQQQQNNNQKRLVKQPSVQQQ